MVVAPFILQSGRAEPYVSLTEVKFSPTASIIDFSNLIENAGPGTQDIALAELISRASSKIDVYCMGKFGSLNATENTYPIRLMMDGQGRFKWHPPFTPILAVTAFSWGDQPGVMNPMPLSSSNCWIEQENIVILAGAAAGSQTFGGISALSQIVQGAYSNQKYCTFSWVNGWANSFTTAVSAAASSSLVLVDVTGIYPSMQLTVWDGVNDEVVVVSSTYVPGTLSVSLSTPLLFAHGVGVNVSALPATIKQACIHFVVAMVKQRGQGGIILNDRNEEVAVEGKLHTSVMDEVAAYDLLDSFKATWGLP